MLASQLIRKWQRQVRRLHHRATALRVTALEAVCLPTQPRKLKFWTAPSGATATLWEEGSQAKQLGSLSRQWSRLWSPSVGLGTLKERLGQVSAHPEMAVEGDQVAHTGLGTLCSRCPRTLKVQSSSHVPPPHCHVWSLSVSPGVLSMVTLTPPQVP